MPHRNNLMHKVTNLLLLLLLLVFPSRQSLVSFAHQLPARSDGGGQCFAIKEDTPSIRRHPNVL